MRERFGTEPGFIGPVGARVRVLADEALRGLHGLVTGANEPDMHLRGRRARPRLRARPGPTCARVEAGRPLPERRRDPHRARDRGGQHLQARHALLRAARRPLPRRARAASSSIWMGSYGIGPARIVAAAIEQFHDEQGISWPRALAPFDVELVTLGKEGEEARAVADRLYDELRETGLDVLYDDRDAQRGREVRRRRAARLPAAADDRQARARGGRGRRADQARPGEALAAARGRRAGGGGAVGKPPLTFRRLSRARPLRRPAARDAARRAAPSVDDPERDRLRAPRPDPGLPRAGAGVRRRPRRDWPRSLFAFIAWTDYLDGMAARITGQYSRLGALLDPLTDRLLVICGRDRGLGLRAAAALGAGACWPRARRSCCCSPRSRCGAASTST